MTLLRCIHRILGSAIIRFVSDTRFRTTMAAQDDIELVNQVIALLQSTTAEDKSLGYRTIDGDVRLLRDLNESVIRVIKDELASIDPTSINIALKWLANSPISADVKERFAPELEELIDSGCIAHSVQFILLKGFHAVPNFIDATEISRSLYFLLNGRSSEGLATPPLIDTLFLMEDLLLPITESVCTQLKNTLSHQEIFVRSRAAQSLSLLARSEFAGDEAKKHQDTIMNALKAERHISVVQPLVDCLYAFCDHPNTAIIVNVLLNYIESAENEIKEQMAPKVATIATVHRIDYEWFSDVILSLLLIVRSAGIEAYERIETVLMFELQNYLTDVDPSVKEKWMGRVSEQLPKIAATIVNEEDIIRFVTKNDGNLYEDDNIQIGCKLETLSNHARLYIIYRNKTGGAFTNFSPSILTGGSLGVQLRVQTQEVGSVVGAGTQVQQLINIVCVQEFTKQLIMHLQFSYQDLNGAKRTFAKSLYLPIFINKFFEPSPLERNQFYDRWISLGGRVKQNQKVFPAAFSMEKEAIDDKLDALGMKNLADVARYPVIYSCSGVIHTQTEKIEVFYRIMPDSDQKNYLLTVRSANNTVSSQLLRLISAQF